MGKGKLRIAVVFGGRSAEHEVSLQSAKNVVAALDPEKYEPVLIGIDREGRWYLNEHSLPLLNSNDPRLISLNETERRVALTPNGADGALVDMDSRTSLGKIDVIFPVLHGPYGEDGSIQGLAKLADVPCVGSDILGSALGMDKDVMKRLLREAGLLVAPFRAYGSEREALADYENLVGELGSDLFVKPANLGSSVGIHHIKDQASYETAVRSAFEYDTKIVAEKTVKGREIEVAVLGNEDPIATNPGEIIPAGDFYSYEAKYIDEHGASLVIPARVRDNEKDDLKNCAVRAYKALCLKGMARVDFFLQTDGAVIVNEVNTIPGFTSISMYPKLWEAEGLPYSSIIDRLIELAQEDFERRKRLKMKPDI